MKKLSLLVALILCVTIGGVYATWLYAETPMDEATHEFKNLGITDVDTNAKSGKIAVTDTLILKIDDNYGNHRPGWDGDVTTDNGGNLQIVFTPNSGAGDTTLNYTITVAKNSYTDDDHTDKPIFVTKDGTTITAAHADAREIMSGTFDFFAGDSQAVKIITYTEVIAKLDVNNTIELTDLVEYEAYRAALEDVKLTLTVSEVVPPVVTP